MQRGSNQKAKWTFAVMVLLVVATFAIVSKSKELPYSQQSQASDESKAAENPAETEAQGSETPAPANATSKLDPNKVYLIIHADDAGLCRSVNRATIDSLEQGIVTSASIMVPCPNFEEFAKYAREHPSRDFGIHLTLNAEFGRYPWKPILPANEVPGLVNNEGYFWPHELQTAAKARADEVERELTAQIERAKAAGIKISHLDTHMGTLLTRPEFLEVYVNLGIKYDLPISFVKNPDVLKKFLPAAGIVGKADGAVRALENNRLPLLDDVFMHYVNGSLKERRAHYFKVLRDLKPGTYELLIHCGYVGRDLFFTGSAGMRDSDREIFSDPKTLVEINRLGIQLVNWKQFRERAVPQKQ